MNNLRINSKLFSKIPNEKKKELEPKFDLSLHPLELQCVKPQKDPYELYLTPVSIK